MDPHDHLPGMPSPRERRTALWWVIPVVVSGALALAIALAFLGWHWSGSDREHAAGWIEAAATLAGLGAAAAAAVFAANAFRLELQREQSRDDERRRDQAQLVSSWGRGQWGVAFANRSPLPVYDVSIVVWKGGKTHGMMFPVLSPTDEPQVLSHVPALIDLHHAGEEEGLTEVELRPKTSMDFTDASGRRWHRDVLGRLHELETPEF